MKVYKSKIALALVLPMAIVLAGIGFVLLYHLSLLSLVILVPLYAFIIHLFLTTYYTIEDKYLIIKSGILIHQKIEIANIKKIAETRSIMSSPALSLDRIEIFYNKFDSIILSPKDKAGFISHLLRLNPKLETQ